MASPVYPAIAQEAVLQFWKFPEFRRFVLVGALQLIRGIL
jgi:hypothetical protein